MPQTIEAIYEDGVFKPFKKVQIKEHEKVNIKIISLDEWEKKFNRIIKNIQVKSSQYSSDEIEKDITETIKEIRKEKNAL